nr:MAG TPA: Scavenger receptor cysteine-rich type 1, SRCR, PRRSV, BALBES NMR.8A [Caudoviricetes sp.]
MIIVDHHHVHCSLFNQQSMNNNHCSLIVIVR